MTGREVRLGLSRSSLTAWQIKDVLAGVAVAGLLVALSQLPFAPAVLKTDLPVICLLCLAPSALDVAVLNRIRHKRYSLHVHPERLTLSQGWVFQQVITIPRSSILSVRFKRGPLSRLLGLTHVSVLTIADHQTIGSFDAAQTELIERFVSGDTRDVHP